MFFRKEKIAITYPCISDRKKVSGEIKLKNNIDIKRFCKETNAKCFEDLDMAKMGENTLIFKNGKIVAKECKDKKDAIKSIEDIKRIIEEKDIFL